jgi:UDP-N-acetylmuramate dehydrogenase
MVFSDNIREKFPLKSYNTFGIDVRTRYFASVHTMEDVHGLFTVSDLVRNEKLLILGGGSNILFTGDFEGLVIKMDIQGVVTVKESEEYREIRSYAGQNWDELVSYSVKEGLGGLENLSLIPGTAGAAPIQNIGAYGAELRDVLVEVCCWDRKFSQMATLSGKDCNLGYRTSIFNTTEKDRYIILSVTFRLQKNPSFNISYGALGEELKRMQVRDLSPEVIRNAVIAVRQRKLPDPSLVGNAGSFFKNPAVSGEAYNSLRNAFPGLVGYPQADGTCKLAAGWMIEHCGWKGYRIGDAGVHHEQALVLVNYGNATGMEILHLAGKIRQSVMERFGVELESEVNVL